MSAPTASRMMTRAITAATVSRSLSNKQPPEEIGHVTKIAMITHDKRSNVKSTSEKGVKLLHLVLADAELETVPPQLASHRVVRWQARRRGRRPTELLLDSSYHHLAMRGLPDSGRRGRPDILHSCLLLALDSPLNREGLLRTYVHTRNDKLITIDPSARLPRAYDRFVGLIEHLFLTGAAPPEKPLLRLEDALLAEIVERIKPVRTITFSERGQRKRYGELFAGLSGDDEVCVVIGAFPHGDFLSDVGRLSSELVCIDPEPLPAPTVVARAIFAYEQTFGVQESRLGGV